MKRRGLMILAVVALLLVVLGGSCVATYNSLVTLDQAVDVENAYERRADLVPNLVATVKGAAAHERETLEAVTQARAQVGSLQLGDVTTTPTAGPAVARSVPKFIREHAALVAAARLQAPPPALQEGG